MSRSTAGPFDVFLSNTSADAVLADAVRQRLEEAGLTCFSPSADLAAGDKWDERIVRALESSRVLVTIISRASIGSPNVPFESGAARAVRVPVLVLLNDLRSSDLPAYLRYQYAYKLWDGLPKLIAAVRKLPERVPA